MRPCLLVISNTHLCTFSVNSANNHFVLISLIHYYGLLEIVAIHHIFVQMQCLFYRHKINQINREEAKIYQPYLIPITGHLSAC